MNYCQKEYNISNNMVFSKNVVKKKKVTPGVKQYERKDNRFLSNVALNMQFFPSTPDTTHHHEEAPNDIETYSLCKGHGNEPSHVTELSLYVPKVTKNSALMLTICNTHQTLLDTKLLPGC